MHHPTDRITHTTAFVTPVVEHCLEREIAKWVIIKKKTFDLPAEVVTVSTVDTSGRITRDSKTASIRRGRIVKVRELDRSGTTGIRTPFHVGVTVDKRLEGKTVILIKDNMF